MFLCVSGTSKKNLVHGALIEAEILTSQLPNVFAQLRLSFCVNTCQVCQHLSSLEMFRCASGTSKKNLVDVALIEAEILTSQLPNVFAQLRGTVLCVNTCHVI